MGMGFLGATLDAKKLVRTQDTFANTKYNTSATKNPFFLILKHNDYRFFPSSSA